MSSNRPRRRGARLVKAAIAAALLVAVQASARPMRQGLPLSPSAKQKDPRAANGIQGLYMPGAAARDFQIGTNSQDVRSPSRGDNLTAVKREVVGVPPTPMPFLQRRQEDNNSSSSPAPSSSGESSSAGSSSDASSSGSATSSAPTSDKPSSSSSSSSSKSSPTSSSTSSSTDKPSDSPDNSLFSVHSKLFPAGIAVCVAILFAAIAVVILLGKCYCMVKRQRGNGTDEEGYDRKDSHIIGNVGRKATLGRSLRRALTGRKLNAHGGSFARRNRENVVLIDVGDEVFAVPAEVASEYERERKNILAEHSTRSGLSSAGSGTSSRLTDRTSMLHEALRKAQFTVAAGQGNMAHGGPQGFDLNSWRRDSAATLYSNTYANEFRKSGVEEQQSQDGLARSLSKRIAGGFRMLAGSDGAGVDEQHNHGTNSFDAEKQTDDGFHIVWQSQAASAPAVPALTRGSEGWAIRRSDEHNVDHSNMHLSQQSSQPKVAADSNPQSGASNERDVAQGHTALSHERVTLKDEAPSSAATIQQQRLNRKKFRQQQRAMLGQPQSGSIRYVHSTSDREQRQPRPHGVAAKRSQECLTQQGRRHGPDPQYRHRAPVPSKQAATSTAQGSPRTLQPRGSQDKKGASKEGGRQGKADGEGRSGHAASMRRPAKPDRGVVSEIMRAGTTVTLGGTPRDAHSQQDATPAQAARPANTRDLYRPLPNLPPSTPAQRPDEA